MYMYIMWVLLYCNRRYRDRSPIRRDTRQESDRRTDQSTHRTDQSYGPHSYSSRGSNVTRKMDPKELERKRQEMMMSAK